MSQDTNQPTITDNRPLNCIIIDKKLYCFLQGNLPTLTSSVIAEAAILISQLIPIENAAKFNILLKHSWSKTIYVTAGEWVRMGDKRERVVEKFFSRIVCQNHIPFSLSII